MKINIGKNTLGDSDKMSVSLKEYGRSTHNLSSAWRSPMGVGTLVPFMKVLGLPGDTFNIDLDTQIMTHPTVGPLFGNFKFQADVFTCPIRLYNAMLHNNTLNIGLDMSKVKLPIASQWTKTGTNKYGKGSLNEYLGVRGAPDNSSSSTGKGDYQIVPHLAYYDVFKNYYANKQEERFYVMGGSSVQNATTIVAEGWKGSIDIGDKSVLLYEGKDSEAKITITGTNINLNDIKTIQYTLDSNTIEMKFFPSEINNYFNILENKPNKVVLGLKRQYYFFNYKFAGDIGTEITLNDKTQNITQGATTEAYTSSFPLTEIDDLREYILSKGREQVKIGKNSEEKLKSLFLYNILYSPNPETSGAAQNIPSIVGWDMGGLCLKTYQSDLFNNWVNKEWVCIVTGKQIGRAHV